MKKTIISLCTAMIAVTTFLSAQIIDTKYFGDIRNYINADSLVIFDIDNTIMEPIQELGTDQWFHHRYDHHITQGLTKEEALEEALAEWYAVQNVTKVKLVEPCAAEVIRELQNNGYTVMGLTTRGLGLCRTTIYQLNTLGVNLNIAAPTQEEVHFMNPLGVLFRSGILFTAGTNKGVALAKFLHMIGHKPQNVVFINDKATHLAEVERVCEKFQVPFIGLRYGFLDEKIANFRQDIADVQFQTFGKILSDQEAECLLCPKE